MIINKSMTWENNTQHGDTCTAILSVHPVCLSSSTSFSHEFAWVPHVSLHEFARVSHMSLHKFLTCLCMSFSHEFTQVSWMSSHKFITWVHTSFSHEFTWVSCIISHEFLAWVWVSHHLTCKVNQHSSMMETSVNLLTGIGLEFPYRNL